MNELEIFSQVERVSAFLITIFILFRLFIKQSEQIQYLIDVIIKRENCEDPKEQ